jgi:hypothetical protein
LLDKVDPNLSKEYSLERYKDSASANNYVKPTFEEFKTELPKFKKSLGIPTIHSLPEEHYAKVYVKSRRIPERFHSELYFAEDFKGFVETFRLKKKV